MALTLENTSRTGQWVFYRVAGYSKKIYIAPFSRVTVQELNYADQINFTPRDVSIKHQIDRGKNFRVPQDVPRVKIISASGGGSCTPVNYISKAYSIAAVTTGATTNITLVSGEGNVVSELTGKNIQFGRNETGDYIRKNENWTVQNPVFALGFTSFDVNTNLGAYTINLRVSPNGFVGTIDNGCVIEGTAYTARTVVNTQIQHDNGDLSSIFATGDLVKITSGSTIYYDSVRSVSVRFGMTSIALNLGPMGNFSGGETLTIQKITPAVAPATDFSAKYSFTGITSGDTIAFTDSSSYSPASWNWVFESGTPGTNTDQNPSAITYNVSSGTLDVALTTTNSYGSDTETKSNYITVYDVGPNLLTDGNFEAVDPSVAWSAGDATLSITTTDPFEGNQSLNLEFDNFSANGDKAGQSVIVESGATYRMDMYFRRKSAIDFIGILVYDNVAGSYTEIEATAETDTNVWIPYYHHFTAPSSAITVYIKGNNQLQGTDFDQVRLRKVL